MSGTVQGAQNGTQLISSGAAGVLPSSFGTYPNEGTRVVTAQYNWIANNQFNEDCSQLAARGMITTPQSMFVDNSANAAIVTITINGTSQVLEVPSFSQGVFPVFFTGTPGYSIQSPITSVANLLIGNPPYVPVTRVYLLNVPAQSAGLWSAFPPGIGMFSAVLVAPFTNLTLKIGPGRLNAATITTVTAVAKINFYDTLGAGGGAGNSITAFSPGTASGTTIMTQMPFWSGLVADATGGTGAVAVTFQ